MPFELEDQKPTVSERKTTSFAVRFILGFTCVGAIAGTRPSWVKIVVWENTLLGKLGFMIPGADSGGIVGACIWGLLALLAAALMLLVGWYFGGRTSTGKKDRA